MTRMSRRLAAINVVESDREQRSRLGDNSRSSSPASHKVSSQEVRHDAFHSERKVVVALQRRRTYFDPIDRTRMFR